MGKIYRALQRSGNVFSEQEVSKRTFKTNALTSMEKKALRRADSHYEQKNAFRTLSSQNLQIMPLKKIDSRLRDLGLSKAQISLQTLKELNESVHRIDGFIAKPESFLKQKFWHTVSPETDFKLNILPILLERRMFVLETYDELVDRMKNYDLRHLANGIADANVKSSIEKILNDLQKKDSVLKKEYQKIEKSRLNIYEEQQKIPSMLEESGERRNKASNYSQSRDSLTTWIMGSLLILIALSIVIAPFVNISVPDILGSAFLIILGFFFGQGIGTLASFRETKKIE